MCINGVRCKCDSDILLCCEIRVSNGKVLSNVTTSVNSDIGFLKWEKRLLGPQVSEFSTFISRKGEKVSTSEDQTALDFRTIE